MTTAKLAWILPLLSLSYDLPDSTGTRLGVSAGGGSYSIISRGCSTTALSADEVPFTSANGFVEHRMGENWWLGMAVDVFHRDGATPRYDLFGSLYTPREAVQSETGIMIKPYASMETDFAEFGIGASFRVKGFTYGVDKYHQPIPISRFRLGSVRGMHVTGSMGFNRPLAASGGWYDLGVGFGLAERTVIWVGVDAIPYEATGLLFKTTFPISTRLSVFGSGRYARVRGITSEYGVSLGVMYGW